VFDSGKADANFHQRPSSAPGVPLHGDGRRSVWSLDMICCFATTVVHDLRNPLATVCAGTEMLVGPDLTSANVKRLAGNVHVAALRMRELISDLMSIVQGAPSVVGICDLREVIVAAADTVLAAKKSARVQIVVEVPEGISLPLVRLPLERVFLNVIGNGIDAMPHGGTINISGRQSVDSVVIAVEDTGLGIPAEVRDHLFEPFVTGGKPEGLGLGLALARQILRSQGGDIWTEPAAGTRFVIWLPVERPQRQYSGMPKSRELLEQPTATFGTTSSEAQV
jgi:signal transduction histidine kinase